MEAERPSKKSHQEHETAQHLVFLHFETSLCISLYTSHWRRDSRKTNKIHSLQQTKAQRESRERQRGRQQKKKKQENKWEPITEKVYDPYDQSTQLKISPPPRNS